MEATYIEKERTTKKLYKRYICQVEGCNNFFTNKKYDFNRHLQRKKHIQNVEKEKEKQV